MAANIPKLPELLRRSRLRQLCRAVPTKMAEEHKEALEEMARAWDTLAREHGQPNVASAAPDTKLPPR
jgi:hypothetical protein